MNIEQVEEGLEELNNISFSLLHELHIGNGYISLVASYDKFFSIYDSVDEKNTHEEDWVSIELEFSGVIPYEDEFKRLIKELKKYYSEKGIEEYLGFKNDAEFYNLEKLTI